MHVGRCVLKQTPALKTIANMYFGASQGCFIKPHLHVLTQVSLIQIEITVKGLV